MDELRIAYTRAQAIEDGWLVDVSETAREVGIRVPVAVTRAVWDAYVGAPTGPPLPGSRLWDVLWRLRAAVLLRTSLGRDGRAIAYPLFVWTAKGRQRVTLVARCGPGDDASAVITIMLPEED